MRQAMMTSVRCPARVLTEKQKKPKSRNRNGLVYQGELFGLMSVLYMTFAVESKW